MFHVIDNFFAAPEDKDPRFARLVRNILLLTLAATVGSALAVVGSGTSQALGLTVAVLAVAILFELLALVFVLRGNLTLSKAIVPLILIVAITIIALNTDTIHHVSVIAYPVIVIIATLLQGRRALQVTTPLTMAAILILGLVDMLGWSSSLIAPTTNWDDIAVGMLLILLSGWILNLLIGRLRNALNTAEQNEQSLSQANQELRELKSSLEQRVEERTAELIQQGLELAAVNEQVQRRVAQFEALAQVMQSIASIRGLHELLPQIARVIHEKFGFYHVGVFLLDEAQEYAVLSASNSEGGQKMLARKHRLRVGAEGIVGYVTATGKPRVAMDVGQDPVFFNNPDLPATHSELALPLRSEGAIAGALDVQSTNTAAFTDEDIQMLSLLADQVSLAIENARLFEETRSALAEAEAIGRQFTREAWSRLPAEQNLVGYRYDIAGPAPLREPLPIAGMAQSAGQARGGESGQVIVPIELRGERIGSLVVQSPTERELTQDELDLIKAVAERVALSAENARLFEETTRRAERERMVSDITGKIRSLNDPQAMVQTAMDELRRALGVSRVEVIPQSVRGAE